MSRTHKTIHLRKAATEERVRKPACWLTNWLANTEHRERVKRPDAPDWWQVSQARELTSRSCLPAAGRVGLHTHRQASSAHRGFKGVSHVRLPDSLTTTTMLLSQGCALGSRPRCGNLAENFQSRAREGGGALDCPDAALRSACGHVLPMTSPSASSPTSTTCPGRSAKGVTSMKGDRLVVLRLRWREIPQQS